MNSLPDVKLSDYERLEIQDIFDREKTELAAEVSSTEQTLKELVTECEQKLDHMFDRHQSMLMRVITKSVFTREIDAEIKKRIQLISTGHMRIA